MSEAEALRRRVGRMPTPEERDRAAWANLAIDRPDMWEEHSAGEAEALRRRVEDLGAAVRRLADAAELFAVEHRRKVDATKALGWIDAARALTFEETAE